MNDHNIASRRRVLIGLGFGLAILAAGGIWRFRPETRLAYVQTVVRNRLGYLQYSDETLNAFVAEFVAQVPAMQEIRGKVIAVQGVALSRSITTMAGEDIAWKLEAFEQKIASEFLKATDFFLYDRDTKRDLQYIGLADPYTNTCWNPVSVLT